MVSAWPYRALLVAALVGGLLAGLGGADFIHGNKDAVDLLVTVFSILAGFLVAVMSLLGGDLITPSGWRVARAEKGAVRAKLIRQKWLFYGYLTTLALIFASRLLASHYQTVSCLLEQVYFGLGTAAFILSFGLPSALLDIQTTRINNEIKRQKSQASILDRN